MADSKPLTLNRDETLVLSDRVSNVEAVQPDEMRCNPLPLLLKLGALYLELVVPGENNATATGTIMVTEAETWLLRAKVNSGDKLASDPLFGIRLARKVYALLLAFDADTDSLPVAAEEGEVMDRQHKDNLAEWHQLNKEAPGDDEKQPA